MIYDCFMFFNELDLLDIRLNVLSDVADRFVLVEATKTFSLEPKPLYYQNNKGRYAAFNDRIIHIVVDRYPVMFKQYKPVSMLGFIRRLLTDAEFEKINYHQIDIYQKSHIAQGLRQCAPDDLIITSDLDEIPNPEQISKHQDTPGLRIFELSSFYYYLNSQEFYNERCEDPSLRGEPVKSYGPAMIEYEHFVTPHALRMAARHKGKIDHPGPPATIIKDGGWHFSFLGETDRIIEKIKAYAHQEYNTAYYLDKKRIEQIIASGRHLFDREDTDFRRVEIDDSFPRYIRQHQKTYRHLIKPLS